MTELDRPNPDALLAAMRSQAAREQRGRLKVFLGMSPGVGKTYAMLEAARRELAAGRDLVIAYVETHGRKETDALAVGMPIIPRTNIEHRGISLTEMDLDAVLARHPQLALVDELAHTNAPGSRHPKRWQDVMELLDAGIDVFTTLNVQHIESRADTVRQITGAEVRETVPDSVLDDAVLELVDLPPAELLQRLGQGKVYLPDRAAAAAENFFREGNLTALRELALRLVADHVGVDTLELRQTQPGAGPWKTGHRLLVAVGPGPLSESLIRWTRRMADGLKCRWVAAHIESSHPFSEAAKIQLARNLSTARELGAEVITTSDEDLVRGILRVARQQNVTQIIVGKPAGSGWFDRFHGERLLRRLTRETGDIDLHVVRAEKSAASASHRRWWWAFESTLQQYLFVIGVLASVGLLNWGLAQFTGPRVPGLVFLLTVVLLALRASRGPVLLAGALSALAWNFFFLPPRFTFIISNVEDGFLFSAYFIVALVLGQLVARIRSQERAERSREERTAALYELTRDLAEAGSRDEVVWQLILQINRVFSAASAVSMPAKDALVPHPDSTLLLSGKELGVADWAYHNRKPAGRYTDNLPGANALHLPMFTERKLFGVLSVSLADKSLATSQRDLLGAFARQAALVLDRVELRNAAEQARVLAESERLSRALLDSISHELRTPLAASGSAASALAASDSATPQQRQLIGEIQEANARLNRVVGNLLDVARLESRKVQPQLDWHDARDLIHTALRDLQRELGSRQVNVDLPTEPLLVRLDFSLAHHALANLVLNAVMHTPPNTPIDVQARMSDGYLVLSVADRGPGISTELLPRIFDKFFRSPKAPVGGSGLGLTIVKGFVEAQGGTVSVVNRPSGGALFTLRFPATEPPPAVESSP